MANLDTIIKDLVIANRILAREDVVDAYGHISVRNPENPKHFFLSRSLSPELVEPGDIVELGLDDGPADQLVVERLDVEPDAAVGVYDLVVTVAPRRVGGTSAPPHWLAKCISPAMRAKSIPTDRC